MVEAKVKMRNGQTIYVRARSFRGLATKLDRISGIKNFTAKTVKKEPMPCGCSLPPPSLEPSDYCFPDILMRPRLE